MPQMHQNTPNPAAPPPILIKLPNPPQSKNGAFFIKIPFYCFFLLFFWCFAENPLWGFFWFPENSLGLVKNLLPFSTKIHRGARKFIIFRTFSTSVENSSRSLKICGAFGKLKHFENSTEISWGFLRIYPVLKKKC